MHIEITVKPEFLKIVKTPNLSVEEIREIIKSHDIDGNVYKAAIGNLILRLRCEDKAKSKKILKQILNCPPGMELKTERLSPESIITTKELTKDGLKSFVGTENSWYKKQLDN